MDGGGRVVSGTTTEVDGVGNTPSRATHGRFGLLRSRDIRASMHIRTVAEETGAEDLVPIYVSVSTGFAAKHNQTCTW